jgi:dTDP-L-rhamnose 4-epimerase
MRILVTGGAGFIGSHVADALIDSGHEVRLLDMLLSTAHRGSQPPDYVAGRDLLVGDMRDPAVLDTALRGVDAICHQAGMVGLGVGAADMPAYVTHNDLGTACLLAAMSRNNVSTLVLASSMVVYGEGRYSCSHHGLVRPGPRRVADLDAGVFDPRCPTCQELLHPEPAREDAALDPRSTYAATKVAQEHLGAVWARETGGRVVALRYHNVYGPRMPRDTPYAGVASIFRSSLARGEPPQVLEDGAQRRDFVHVRDVAAANLAALQRQGSGFAAYNIGSGHPHTVGELATVLAHAIGGPPAVVTGRFRHGDVRHIIACPDLAREQLDFQASTRFADGIREFARAPLRE